MSFFRQAATLGEAPDSFLGEHRLLTLRFVTFVSSVFRYRLLSAIIFLPTANSRCLLLASHLASFLFLLSLLILLLLFSSKLRAFPGTDSDFFVDILREPPATPT